MKTCRSCANVNIYSNNLHTLKHRSNFFVLQVTIAILRDDGSAVQRVYNEKVSNQDQLNKGKDVVTLSGNLLLTY